MFREVSERIVYERWPDGDGETVEFRLVLRGRLPPDRRGTADTKHRIRRELHPQLRSLWQQHPALKGAFKDNPFQAPVRPVVEHLADNYARCGFRFVPLIRDEIHLACSLNILLLRREAPYKVMGAGDLDGRVKTLLDGLRMPGQCSELHGASPQADEDPFFCLLEDDRLIYDLGITTDRLLVPPEQGEDVRDVFAVIQVKVKSRSGGDVTRLDRSGL